MIYLYVLCSVVFGFAHKKCAKLHIFFDIRKKNIHFARRKGGESASWMQNNRDTIPNQWTKPAFNAGLMDGGRRNPGIAVSRNPEGGGVIVYAYSSKQSLFRRNSYTPIR